MGSQLALKSRIRSTESLAKIFNAQEMIASSHIAKARDVALNAKPYTDAIFDAVQALVAHTHITHPIAVKDEKNPRVAVLALTSDRGMAGPYTSSIIRETESLLSRLDAAGKQPELFVYGRRGSTYYKYRNRDIAATWEGDTDQPGVEIAETISNTLMDAYMKPAEKGGVSELYIVYTEFINMVVQKVRVLRMLPVEIVKNETKVPDPDEEAPATADAAVHFRAQPRKVTGCDSAEVHSVPYPRVPADCGRVGNRKPPERHAHGNRQRTKPDRRPYAQAQRFPPGLDHPGTYRNHRQR